MPEKFYSESLSDQITFEQLQRQYNYRLSLKRHAVFTRLILNELKGCTTPTCMLDIGCGTGIGKNLKLLIMLREHIDNFWAVEPDRSVKQSPGLFTKVLNTTIEKANLPESYFDVAYAFMVMEHIADPDVFMSAVHRCLKPGGRFLFATPNAKHYFTIFSRACKGLGVDELSLRLVRSKDVAEYHYPIEYKFSSPKVIDACAKRLRFDAPRYAYAEEREPSRYFPGLLQPIFWAMSLKRYVIRNPNCLLNLFGRITKPASPVC